MNTDLYAARFQQALTHFGIHLADNDQRFILDMLPPTAYTLLGLKVQAQSLSDQIRSMSGQPVKRTKALEMIARIHGHRNWHSAQQVLYARLPKYDPRKGWAVTPPAGHPRFMDEGAFFSRPDERESVPTAMYTAFVEYFNHRTPPVGWARAALEGRLAEAETLAGHDARHVRALLDLAMYYSSRTAFGTPERVAAYLARPYGSFVPIGGVNVGGVIAALYNVAEPTQYGYREFDITPMTQMQGADVYLGRQPPSHSPKEQTTLLDYVGHTRMKLMFERGVPWVDVERFEQDRLPGIAAYAIDVLRETGPTDARLLAVRHQILLKSAAQARIDLETLPQDPGLTDAGRDLLSLLGRTLQP